MARISLDSAISERFLKSLQATASSVSPSSSNPLQGNSSQVTIKEALRTGARTYGSVVSSLNSLIAYINVSEDNLTKLDKMAEKMSSLAKRASQSSLGYETRAKLDLEYNQLAKEFEKVRDEAVIQKRNYLKLGDLEELFAVVGFDAEKAQGVRELFEQFKVPSTDKDKFLVSEHSKGPRPVPVPSSMFTGGDNSTPIDRNELFTTGADRRNIKTRVSAYRVYYDLEQMRKQTGTNLDALRDAREFLGENINLVREAGLAMLDLSEQLSGTEEASVVAQMLRMKILANAPAALAQAENLEPLTVAALLLNKN